MSCSILSSCQRGHKWCRHGRFWVSLNPRSVFTPDLNPSRKLFRPTLNGKCGSFCQVSVHHLTGMEVFWLYWGQYWGLLGIPNGDQVALSMKWTWKKGAPTAEGPPQLGHTSGLKQESVWGSDCFCLDFLWCEPLTWVFDTYSDCSNICWFVCSFLHMHTSL